jgi:integrase
LAEVESCPVTATTCNAARVAKIAHQAEPYKPHLRLPAVAARMSLVSVSRRLGHSSPDLTARVYGHEYRSSAQTDADALSAFRAAEATGRVVPLRSIDN